jgi:hypothetical protein
LCGNAKGWCADVRGTHYCAPTQWNVNPTQQADLKMPRRSDQKVKLSAAAGWYSTWPVGGTPPNRRLQVR